MKVHHTSFHTASSVNAMASKMNCKFENKYIFLFFFFVIIIIIPINAITIGEGRNVTPPPLPNIIQKQIDAAIAEDIASKDIVINEIAAREQRLKANSLSSNDSLSKKVKSKSFVVQKSNVATSGSAKNVNIDGDLTTEIPYGGFIEFGSDGKTRFYSPDGIQQYTSDDVGLNKAINSGNMILDNYVIEVPSGSTVRHVGKNIHISHGGAVIATIIDNRETGTSQSITNAKLPNFVGRSGLASSPPILDTGRSWVAWTQHNPAVPIAMFSADWIIPNNPIHAEDNVAANRPSNMIFNGIQPASYGSKTEILQPVSAFNYHPPKDIWTGESCIVAVGYSICSEPENRIVLNTGDRVTGIVGYASGENYWHITLWRNDVSSTGSLQFTTLLIDQHSDYISQITPDAVNLFLAYEAYYCNADGISNCIPFPSDSAKPADIHFLSVDIYDSNYNRLTGTVWDPRVTVETPRHPGLSGIHIENNTYETWIRTNSNQFTITPISGAGGSINPPTSQTITKGSSQSFHVESTTGYVIDKIVIDSDYNNAITYSPNKASVDIPFSNIQNDHSIEATFKTGTTSYTITPIVVGTGGSISPSTPVTVTSGGTSPHFTITADSTHEIDTILFNSVSQTITDRRSMTIYVSNVQSNTQISATFRTITPPTYTVTPSYGTGGTGTPSTAVTVPAGGSQSFNVTANTHYEIDTILVNTVSQTITDKTSMNVTVSNVQSSTSISATFKLSPPVANFTASPRTGPAPLSVVFTDTSTGSPTSWNWSFGDGNTTNSNLKDPVHTYNKSGSYSVSLSVKNSTGHWSSTTRTNYISVTLPPLRTATTLVGVFRNSTAVFYLKNGTTTTTQSWGLSTDTPVTGDWNGDGLTDVGVFRNSTAVFYLKNGTITTTQSWGLSTDTPVTGKWQ